MIDRLTCDGFNVAGPSPASEAAWATISFTEKLLSCRGMIAACTAPETMMAPTLASTKDCMTENQSRLRHHTRKNKIISPEILES